MQKQGTMWHYLAVLVVLASCGLGVLAGGGAEKQDPPKPLPPKIAKAWTDAGAVVGWMNRDRSVSEFYFQFRAQEKGEPGAIPAFGFTPWKKGLLVKLPDPGVPFALDLYQTKVTD